MSLGFSPKKLSLIAIMSTVYMITNMIPISQFIGATVFIPLSIVFVPVMAYYLSSKEALISASIGGLGSIFINPAGAAVFGIFAILTPAVAATLGSLGFMNRKYTLIPISFLMVEFFFYVIWYGGTATYLWGTHYAIAILLGLAYYFTGKDILFLIPVTTMCENAMLNIYSITVAGLPASLWGFIIVPSMIERTIATVGAFMLIQGLNRALPGFMERN